jgi:uncharacterized protein YecE (DUF72 family)
MVEPLQIGEQRVWIGCSGYVYKHWRGVFYPEGLPQSRWLEHYTRHFPTVELNNTHYTLPSEKTFEAWRDNSPEGFLYAVKASRFITHMKKLKEPREHLGRLFERSRLLGPKLGPTLYQLPPRWGYDHARLEAFLSALPTDLLHTVEVRDPSWLNPDFFALLERFGVAYCIASVPMFETPVVATAPLVYLRLHGSGTMYYYDYPLHELQAWCEAIVRFAREGREVFCYFDNDPEGWAVKNALQLMEMVGSSR